MAPKNNPNTSKPFQDLFWFIKVSKKPQKDDKRIQFGFYGQTFKEKHYHLVKEIGSLCTQTILSESGSLCPHPPTTTSTTTFSMVVLRESDVNSSLEILWSSPVSILRHITCITKNSENYGSPVKSLVVLKELPEGLQEEAELPEEDNWLCQSWWWKTEV